jgi:hypothetical protein
LKNKRYKTLTLIILGVITPILISQFVPLKTLTPVLASSPTCIEDPFGPTCPREPPPIPGPNPNPVPGPRPEPSGTCSSFPCIVLKSHSVFGTPWEHSWIVYTDERGIQKYYRGGAALRTECGASPTAGWIEAEHGFYRAGTVDWDPNAKSLLLIQGPEARGKDIVLENLANRIGVYGRPCIPYAPWGPNSNTVVYTMLFLAGLPQQATEAFRSGFCNCPGWDNKALFIMSN